ncbi:MAG: KHG/KDPG aldolase/sugar kinase fusion protein [Planctomycetota bacterium]
MNPSRQLWERLKQSRLIALLAPRSIDECIVAYETLDPLGVVLEIALRTEVALAGLSELRRRHAEALVLAGTVMTQRQAELAIDGGAAGVVSADYIPPVVETCVRHDVMCIPGGLADAGKQLVQKAALYGCDLEELRRRHPHQWVYKLFPAFAGSSSQVDHASAWKAVYKDLSVVYTGGVTAANLGEIARKDKGAIVCGSALTRDVGNPSRMEAEGRRWLEILHAYDDQAPHRESASTARARPDSQMVVTLGEIMLRLSPPHGKRLGHAVQFDVGYGGAEANVAVSLAGFGVPSRFVTALPEDALGDAALNRLRAAGVDTSHVRRHGKRLGIYFLEHGAAQRPSRVIYDRAGSAFAELGPGLVAWDAVFEHARWFHWSGITPALSERTAAATREALQAARRHGLTVSVDLNYRAKLWTRERAREVMTPLMEGVGIAIANESDIADVFGLQAGKSDAEAGRLDLEGYGDVARQMVEKFGLDLVAITLRESRSATYNDWSACLFDGRELYVSRKYSIEVVDRVGAGDAFAAGLIYAHLQGKEPQQALEFAVAAGCLKHTIEGDFNAATVSEVEALAGGEASGRVKR